MQDIWRVNVEAARGLARAAAPRDGIDNPQRDLATLLREAERVGTGLPSLTQSLTHTGALAATQTPGTALMERGRPVPPPSTEERARAQRLLQPLGVDVDRLSRDAQQMQLRTPAPPPSAAAAAAAIPAADVDSFVRGVHAGVLSAAVVESMHTTVRGLDAGAAAWQMEEWERSKEALLAVLGFALPARAPGEQAGADMSMSSPGGFGTAMDLSASGPAGTGETQRVPIDVAFGVGEGDVMPRSQVHSYAAQYAREVREIAAVTQSLESSAGIGRVATRVITTLAAVAENNMETVDEAFAGVDISQRTRLWLLLQEIVREGELPGAGYRYLAEEYGSVSVDPRSGGVSSRRNLRESSLAVSLQWAAGSFAFLSSLFRHVLEMTVAGSPKHAPSGLTTGVTAYIIGYLSLLRESRNQMTDTRGVQVEPEWYALARDSGAMIGDVPVWPQVFLSLRCGARQEALQILDSALASATDATTDVRALLQDVRIALQAYCAVFDAIDAATGRGTAYTDARGVGRASVSEAVDNAVARCNSPTTMQAIARVGVAYRRERSNFEHSKPADGWLMELTCLLGGAAGDPDHQDGSIMSRTRLQDVIWHRLWCVLTSALSIRTVQAVDAATRQAGLPLSASDRALSQPYSLQKAAGLILDGYEAYDPGARKPYRYAEALLLMGEPEAAVAYLANHGAAASTAENPTRHLIDAVHIAVATNYYGALRVWADDARVGAPSGAATPRSSLGHGLYDVPVSSSGGVRGTVRGLDLGFLLTEYCRSVLRHNPAVRADYLSLLPDPQQRQSALARTLVDTRAFAELAGPLDTSAGVLRPAIMSGHIALHGRPIGSPVTSETEVVAIVMEAARQLREEGIGMDAVQLFIRAPMAGLAPALELLCEVLGNMVDEPLRPPSVHSTEIRSDTRAHVRSVALAVLSVPAPSAGMLARGGSETLGVSAVLEAEGLANRQRGLQTLLLLCDFVDIVAQLPHTPGRSWTPLTPETRMMAESALAAMDAADVLPRTPAENAWGRLFDPQPHETKQAIVRLLPEFFFVIRSLFEYAKGRAAASLGVLPGRVIFEELRADIMTRPGGLHSVSRDTAIALQAAHEYQERAAALVTGHSALLRRYVPPERLADLALHESEMR